VTQTERRGCDFHRAHAIYTHLSTVLGLKAEYQNPTFLTPCLKDIAGALFALAFIEIGHVVAAFDQIVVHAAPLVAHRPSVLRLFQYFRRTWLRVTAANPAGDLEYIALWNYWDDPNERHTNNDCEGWHRVLNSQLRRSRNLWQYIRVLQTHQEQQSTRYAQFLNG
jgi:hypothetical protein